MEKPVNRRQKRSVGVVVEEGWRGWDELVAEVERMVRLDRKAFLAFLFLTGMRVSEALSVKAKQVREAVYGGRRFILVEGYQVSKRYVKTGAYYDEDGRRHYFTRPRREIATLAFPAQQPLADYILQHVENVRRSASGDARLWPFCRQHAWRIVNRATGKFCHYYRAKRAVNLVVEYGFTPMELQSFFKWKSWNTIMTYARLSPTDIAQSFLKRLKDM
ncbi:MAG: tyrosine-type recombinase/integrase [Candidatus Caldarchaeum sp.]